MYNPSDWQTLSLKRNLQYGLLNYNIKINSAVNNYFSTSQSATLVSPNPSNFDDTPIASVVYFTVAVTAQSATADSFDFNIIVAYETEASGVAIIVEKKAGGAYNLHEPLTVRVKID